MSLRLALIVGTGVLIAILIGIVLWQRGALIERAGTIQAATTQIDALTAANVQNQRVIATMAAARIDNDAIADAVARRIGSNTVRETETRTIIEKAKADDPIVYNWAVVPVPGSVRSALKRSTDPVRR
jgi:hypothetical protein